MKRVIGKLIISAFISVFMGIFVNLTAISVFAGETTAPAAVPDKPILLEGVQFSYEESLIPQDIYKPYTYHQRYYLPLRYFIDLKAGTVSCEGNDITVAFADKAYVFNKWVSYITVNGIRIDIVEKPHIIEGSMYLSISDLTRIFGLVAAFDYTNSRVNLYENRAVPEFKLLDYAEVKQKAFVRLEDIMLSGEVTLDNLYYLEKLRIEADNLFAKSVPFHVAWIPKYVNPPLGIENDLTQKFNIANADYVYTLDYMDFKGGLIGLHGYTHASGNDASAVGADFGPKINTTAEQAAAQMKRAIDTAKYLQIKYYFFEFPHYAYTETQREVAGKLFKYIYQGYDQEPIPKMVKGIVYIPTPLDHVKNTYAVEPFMQEVDKTIAGNVFGSFFIHPSIEHPSIMIYEAEGAYPEYGYDSYSPLNRIVDKMQESGYVFKNLLIYGK